MKSEFHPQHFAETVKLQQIASNPANSVFVSASAGSGKTKILTDRVLRLLLDGFNPSKILCLTYTKVAAFEMQNRIYKELSEWSILKDADLEKRIAALTGTHFSAQQMSKARSLFNVILDDFEGIKINTIHSFCQNLMSKFPIEAGIKPNFRIIDQVQESQLLLEAKNKLLKEALVNAELNEQISAISANLNEDDFLALILQLINKRSDLEITKEQFFGLENLNNFIFKIFNCENESEKSIQDLITNPLKDADFDGKNLRSLSESASLSKAKTDLKHSSIILAYLQNPNPENFAQYLKVFLTEENEARKSVFTKAIAAAFNNFEEIIELEQKRLIDLIEKINSFQIANLTTILLKVANKMLSLYLELKNQNGFLDYHDLIAKSVKLLTNLENSAWIKYKLDGQFEHILVDESQDTNQLQWQIIKAISDDFASLENDQEQKRSIFIVGDDKQSIFSFQDADPKIFSEVWQHYQKQLGLNARKMEKVDLNNSFRSLKNILQLVDLAFREPKYQRAISRVNLVNHNPIRIDGLGKVEIWPVINVKKEEKSNKNDFCWELNFEPSSEENSKEILAQIIAKKIKVWIDEKRILKSQKRPVKAGDFMILLKNRTNNLGNLIVKNLQIEGIAVNGSDKIDLMQNIIVLDLLSLAKFLLLNEDDLSLAELLKSPICGINEDELFLLCQEKNEQKISLFQALKNNPQKNFTEIGDFLEEAKKYFAANPFKIYQLFSFILENQNKKAAIIAHFGLEAKEILNHFLNLCLNFQNNEIASLENFISLLNNFDLTQKIEGSGLESDEVKITTIHSAKGLEANIVILADCAHNSKEQFGGNGGSKILWLKKGNYKIPIWNAGKKSSLINAIKDEEKALQQEEYLRLLYVALTRAKEEIYIGGFGKNLTEHCWYNVVKNCLISAEDFNGGEIKTKESGFKELVNFTADFLENDEILIAENEEETAINEEKIVKSNEPDFTIPAFLHEKQPSEKTVNILYPSKQNTKAEASFNFNKNNLGKVIHKILEIFPERLAVISDKSALILDYLNLNHSYLIDAEKQEILRQILNIFTNSDLAFLFGANSKSEVPVMGKIDGQLILGKIDRLIVNENDIVIVDYKSDVLKEEEMAVKALKYKEQLGFYSEIMSLIYPGKMVKSAIVWTYLGKAYFFN